MIRTRMLAGTSVDYSLTKLQGRAMPFERPFDGGMLWKDVAMECGTEEKRNSEIRADFDIYSIYVPQHQI